MARIIIIGGGPAGIMAAGAAAKKGHDVRLLEKNHKLGKKLYITGKGRCNVTNNADIEDFIKAVPRNPKFAYSALYAFTNNDLIHLIESMGVEIKIERGGRVFPASDKSSDILDAFSKYVRKCGADIMLNTQVKSFKMHDGIIEGVQTSNGFMQADHFILCCGGASYPSTGSDGSGFAFAKELGHCVTEILPSLVPLESDEKWIYGLTGLQLKNVVLSAYSGGKKKYSEMGEMLFTHFGVSGPLVLSASALIDLKKPTSILIDLKPALSKETLSNRVQRDFEANSKKQLSNSLFGLMPSSIVMPIINKAGLDPYKQVDNISKAEKERLVDTLKGLTIQISGTRPLDEAIITRGGVSIKEINPSTMASRLIKNLSFAGEMIDIDAFTGGYNIQLAASTGFLAGDSIEI